MQAACVIERTIGLIDCYTDRLLIALSIAWSID